jgi:T5SS/PEP-CTERM-associated repeat protein
VFIFNAIINKPYQASGANSMSHLNRVFLVSAVLAALVASRPKTALGAVTFSGDTTIGSQIQIGINSFGTLRIDGGSSYSPASFSTVTLGVQQNGVGIATVTGPGSQWIFSSSSSIDVGSSGIGRLEILDGGIMSLSSGGQLRIATSPSSQGTVVVRGPGSLLNVGSQISLGGTSTGGSALLQISDSAIVNGSTTPMTIWAGGRVELSDGLLRANQLTNNGAIIGSGEVAIVTTSTMTNSGRIQAGSGDLLRFTSSNANMQNSGVIAAEGGELEFYRTISNSTIGPSAANMTLRDGVLRVGTVASGSGAQLNNSAVLASLGGENDFYGRITNSTNGLIAVTNDSVLRFHDDVTADAGVITVFPGSSAVFLEDLTINMSAMLQADLAGTNQDTGFGQIEVVGTAQLGGAVGAALAPGYTPQAGDAFPLLAAGSIIGSPALGAMPALPSGLKWDLDVVANRLILNVVPGLAGDYNGNGFVDTADYIVWRHTVGQTGVDLPGDGDSNGKVDAADYDFWRSRFGNSITSGSATAAAVPEPASIVVFFAVLTFVARRGGRS